MWIPRGSVQARVTASAKCPKIRGCLVDVTTWALVMVWVIELWLWGCPAPCRTLGSKAGLYPLVASSTSLQVLTTQNVQNYLESASYSLGTQIATAPPPTLLRAQRNNLGASVTYCIHSMQYHAATKRKVQCCTVDIGSSRDFDKGVKQHAK